ncbi:hypothetical protein FNV43_RR19413 [Rhamnella rubrinervis]|uniref:Uncharacterized protein n=1 Tax=Rhamnella rubrinervis TaxID=2594499 RepID=A0A8K0DXR0_9ROSA|nr:hypothetical protein FNV43_RR19413 [Rhamnella rubrinervis]
MVTLTPEASRPLASSFCRAPLGPLSTMVFQDEPITTPMVELKPTENASGEAVLTQLRYRHILQLDESVLFGEMKESNEKPSLSFKAKACTLQDEDQRKESRIKEEGDDYHLTSGST